MTDRWMLSRAGIINVYQYVNETIEFGGGRLLLRGVNGSGKSTAMNMLLPFLLDAQTRRIDAAGEQANVLRGWMLSGREEAQPVGYLWLEFRRGDAYFVCGCGIKANRSTDRVSTWWFTTDRRPGIDLALVEGKVPLSVDALKATIGASTVFSHDQRSAYRNDIRNRLFGGADLDQHIRLLHVVRNPRVGDRIDVDLPEYLQGALPQLSDAAVDDAAQPLEDLEEHRRNVEALTRTAASLDALFDIYQSYARTELRARASAQLSLVEHADGRRRAEATARRDAAAARVAFERSRLAVADLEAAEVRLRNEIAALRESDAYKSGQELDDLRSHVASLARAVGEARRRLDRSVDRVTGAAAAVVAAARQFSADQAMISAQLSELEITAESVSLVATIPPLPSVATHPLDSDDDPAVGTPPTLAPDGPLAVDNDAAQLATVRAAALVRRDDVGEVRAAIATVGHHENQLRVAEGDHARAAAALEVAGEAYASAVEALASAVSAWQQQLRTWIDDLAGATRRIGIAPLDPAAVDIADLGDRRHEIADRLSTVASDVIAAHETAATLAAGRREALAAELVGLRAEHDELSTRTSPPPPSTTWQRSERRAVLGELVDFDPQLGPAERIGLESALEASGLLGAELGRDGLLRAADGELIASGQARVTAPLSALLQVTIPDHRRDEIEAEQVEAVLASISTQQTAEATDAATVVTTDGWFRIGALTGRWSKAAAEHIGVTARRQAIERMLAELATRIDATRRDLDTTAEAEAEARRQLADAAAIRRRLPGAHIVSEAIQFARTAERQLDVARERTLATRAALASADALHADAVSAMRRTAATHQLPHDTSGLDTVDRSLAAIAALCDAVARELTALARACDHWLRTAAMWRDDVADRTETEAQLQAAVDEHEPRAMRLATLEDSVGADYAEVLASLTLSLDDADRTVLALAEARNALSSATTLAERQRAAAAGAATELADAEQRCVRAVPLLRRALAIPGLVAAATHLGDTPDAPESGSVHAAPIVLPVVAATVDGARELATAVLRAIPSAARDNAGAESIRQSLRQRRATLGAGWDAEDHQPDGELPLSIEVNGPLGRMPLAAAAAEVGIQLRQRAGLLSAQQDQALRNLLQGLIAREVADKMHAAKDLVALMNKRLDAISTAHGIGASLRWRRRDDLDPAVTWAFDLLAKPPDLRTAEEDRILSEALSDRIENARRANPEAPYRELIADVLDYKQWHQMAVLIRRPGQPAAVLSRRTPLSEGEKKIVSYLPLFAAVAASSDALAPGAPRFVLLDDAFAKVSEDNHGQLFGLLVEMDLDFIATSERLWGTHATVPELAITEVLRDAELGVIVLEHSRWNGTKRTGSA